MSWGIAEQSSTNAREDSTEGEDAAASAAGHDEKCQTDDVARMVDSAKGNNPKERGSEWAQAWKQADTILAHRRI